RVKIKIYDSIGELVKEFDSPPGEAGTANEVTWDGENGEGEKVGIGVYFCVIEAGGQKEIVKIAVE
ncbi:MAG: FlgD immunoglobulin-like domain containing protein, partial [bacterium]|nr:FlgD immunoglobulin-like domain containing protein [bacterium]